MEPVNNRHRVLVDAIEKRISANYYDSSHILPDSELTEIIRLATLAPTAFNFQKWRFIAVRTPEAKRKLWEAASGQAKVLEASATFIICGQLPDHSVLAERLRPSVEAGFMPAATSEAWVQGADALYTGNARMQRDEAIRSATFGAATLMFAAAANNLATGAMVGFDPDKVVQEFGLGPNEVPVLLMTIGRALPDNWPQKPRRPLQEVLEFA
ncbi:nitroreductase family protein [Ciceribacter ferrooxidans]|uniref:Nitroreductase family protein n=1 Tax=Ciceribacter ferrooxidans TaxID=2509717 RepID=A0A4Q2TX22_9HYPH|nr:nitroreductase family protein [Ciceribacter ferrooxidans]RYC27836.1 nitroreductase family protein [Ciceribacter ferrooxidans]